MDSVIREAFREYPWLDKLFGRDAARIEMELGVREKILWVLEGGENRRIVLTDLSLMITQRPSSGLEIEKLPLGLVEEISVGPAPPDLERPDKRDLVMVRVREGKKKLRVVAMPIPMTASPDGVRLQLPIVNALLHTRHRDWRRTGDLPDRFECPQCGRWADFSEALTARVKRITRTGMPISVLDLLQGMAEPDSPLRPAILQQQLQLEYEDAVAKIERGVKAGLLKATKGGAVRAPVVCSMCSGTGEVIKPPPVAVRSGIPPQLRFRVLQRDGFRCQYCGRSQREGVVLHLDHVIPFSQGGETTEENLITACEECNLGKSGGKVL